MKDYLKSINPFWFLMIGVVCVAMTHMTFGIDIFAWFANVPFLIYLSFTKGGKSRWLFVLALVVAWSFVVFKIITPPIPYIMIFLFSIPITLFHLPAYLIWDKFKVSKWAMFLFSATLTIMEWIQYTFTPFASWGVMAYSQSHSLNIMQSLSVFGMAGLSFLIYWVNISIVQVLVNKQMNLRPIYLPIMLVISLIIWGSLRVDVAKSKGVATLYVATVGTNSDVAGLPLPTKERNNQAIADLLQKTEMASRFGAEIVVWNEASFFVFPKGEANVINSIKKLSQKQQTAIIASYVVPVSEDPFRYENKIVFVNHQGEVAYSYLKHQPVPGEPAIQGKEPFQAVLVGESKLGAAICYDYGYPYIAQAYGKLGVDIVAIPSSDWRGIDPLHTQMAAFRAVEQGHSIIRSTRFGLSAMITPYGEMISQSSSFDDHNKIMIANLPSKGVTTTYSMVGDLFIYLCFGFLLVFFLVTVNRK